MTASRLSVAEQRIDLATKTELFRGQEIETVTGRLLLHAADGHGQPLCDHQGPLTLAGRQWDTRYLPHLPRCQDCLAQTGDAPEPVHGGPATGVDIRTAHNTHDENAAAAALRAVLGEHDLRRWMFTDLVTIDESMRGGLSHPLTIGPGILLRRPALTLTTFLHEQLHWLDGPGMDAATAEASRRWPDPPPLSAGGATDATSTWAHLVVCALEYHSLSELTGPAAAEAELRQHSGYAWIYGQILASPDRFSGFLHRHGLQVPARPPVPRRCFS